MRNLGEELSMEEVLEMINDADQNGDGLIDFAEFIQMVLMDVSACVFECGSLCKNCCVRVCV